MLSLYMEEELEENDDIMLWQNVVDHAEEVGSVTLPTTTCATTKSSSSVTTSASSLSGGHDSATITSTLLPSAPLQQMNALQTACAPGVRLQFLSSFFGCYCKRYFFFFCVAHTHLMMSIVRIHSVEFILNKPTHAMPHFFFFFPPFFNFFSQGGTVTSPS